MKRRLFFSDIGFSVCNRRSQGAGLSESHVSLEVLIYTLSNVTHAIDLDFSRSIASVQRLFFLCLILCQLFFF